MFLASFWDELTLEFSLWQSHPVFSPGNFFFIFSDLTIVNDYHIVLQCTKHIKIQACLYQIHTSGNPVCYLWPFLIRA